MASPLIRFVMAATVVLLSLGTAFYTGLLSDLAPLAEQPSRGTADESISGNDADSSGIERSGPPEGVSRSDIDQAAVIENHNQNVNSLDRIIDVEFNQSFGTVEARKPVEVRIDSDTGTKLVDVRNVGGFSRDFNETVYIDNITTYTRRETESLPGDEADTTYSKRRLDGAARSIYTPLSTVSTYGTILRGNYTQYVGSSDGLYTLKSEAPIRAANGSGRDLLSWTSYVQLDSRGVIKSGNATFAQNSSVGENVTSTLTYSTDDRPVEIEEPDWVSKQFNDSQVSTAGN